MHVLTIRVLNFHYRNNVYKPHEISGELIGKKREIVCSTKTPKLFPSETL